MQEDTIVNIYKEGLKGLDFEERKPIYDEVQAEILKEAPISYLYSLNALVAYNKRITNVDPTYFGQVNWKIWEWKVAA